MTENGRVRPDAKHNRLLVPGPVDIVARSQFAFVVVASPQR